VELLKPRVRHAEAILAQLSDIAERVLARCKAKGASQAEVGLNQDRGLGGQRAHGRSRDARVHA
jgi:hypothetical protein